MQKVFPPLISILFHPMFMPVYGLLILFNSGTFVSYIPYDAKKYIFLIVLICTVLLPASFIPFYLFRKIINNIHMSTNKERIIPLIIHCLFFYLAYVFLNKLHIPAVLISYMLACAITVFLALLVTIKWKISLHMVGIGGLIGTVIIFSIRLGIDLKTIWMILILFAGLTGYSRLASNSHNPSQIYAGFLLGFLSVSGVLLIG
jgi:membrane-associated phospholipid phosphatase